MQKIRPRIGLTGSTGVTGRTLLSTWRAPEFFCFSGDIRKRSDVSEWYESIQPLDAVLHLAALVPVHLVEADPVKAFEINALGTLNLLEEVRRLSEKVKPWFFYSSTSHVYTTTEGPISETASIDPINLYGETKAQGERWCDIYAKRFDLPICVTRIFSTSSPLQPKTYFVPAMIEKIKNMPREGVLEARGLNGTRDFLTTDQICQAIAFLFEKRARGTFNLGSGTGTKLLSLVEAIKTKLGREDVQVRALQYDNHHLVANVAKMNQLGLKFEFNLDQFLESVLVKEKGANP